MELLHELKERLGALSTEAREIVHQRELFENQIKAMETRLTQIVGAIKEIDMIVKKAEEKDVSVPDVD